MRRLRDRDEWHPTDASLNRRGNWLLVDQCAATWAVPSRRRNSLFMATKFPIHSHRIPCSGLGNGSSRTDQNSRMPGLPCLHSERLTNTIPCYFPVSREIGRIRSPSGGPSDLYDYLDGPRKSSLDSNQQLAVLAVIHEPTLHRADAEKTSHMARLTLNFPRFL